MLVSIPDPAGTDGTMTVTTRTQPRARRLRFGPLFIGYDDRVLRPRRWTKLQSHWAAELLTELPPGPVLELCSGAGQIGLLATLGNDRPLVQVDSDEAACGWAQVNAERAGRASDVRCGEMAAMLVADERFPLILADPPWVPRAAVSRYPEDPVTAIDGGADGLDVARRCVEVIDRHLLDAGAAILQLGTEAQADGIGGHLERHGLVEAGRKVVPGSGVLLGLLRG